jgi:hypothetical protein
MSYMNERRTRDSAIRMRLGLAAVGAAAAVLVGAEPASSASQDTAPPTAPSQVTVVANGGNGIAVNFFGSFDNVGVARYVAFDGDEPLDELPQLRINGALVVTHLSPGRVYELNVRAQDAAGNFSDASNAVEWLIPASGDHIAPSVPQELRVESGQLVWDASTDDVSGPADITYVVYRNGEFLGTILGWGEAWGGETFFPNDCTPIPHGSYTVKAVDASSNFSAASAPAAL